VSELFLQTLTISIISGTEYTE